MHFSVAGGGAKKPGFVVPALGLSPLRLPLPHATMLHHMRHGMGVASDTPLAHNLDDVGQMRRSAGLSPPEVEALDVVLLAARVTQALEEHNVEQAVRHSRSILSNTLLILHRF